MRRRKVATHGNLTILTVAIVAFALVLLLALGWAGRGEPDDRTTAQPRETTTTVVDDDGEPPATLPRAEVVAPEVVTAAGAVVAHLDEVLARLYDLDVGCGVDDSSDACQDAASRLPEGAAAAARIPTEIDGLDLPLAVARTPDMVDRVDQAARTVAVCADSCGYALGKLLARLEALADLRADWARVARGA